MSNSTTTDQFIGQCRGESTFGEYRFCSLWNSSFYTVLLWLQYEQQYRNSLNLLVWIKLLNNIIDIQTYACTSAIKTS